MIVAGEPSGDLLGAEIVRALRAELATTPAGITTDYQPLKTSLEPRFFGAGGENMARAGVELAFDMTVHAVTGLTDVIKKYSTFRRLGNELFELAHEREPDVFIGVDFSGFNRRLAHKIRSYARPRRHWFHDWQPKMVQYVSPQVWASREGRAQSMAQDYDLLLSIFPFEKDWYASRTPRFHVEFVGHPIVDRYATIRTASVPSGSPTLLVLPGSRPGELRRHLPVMLGALGKISQNVTSLRQVMVLPNQELANLAKSFQLPGSVEIQIGGLADALSRATLAIASTGTVTMECAYFGVPAIAIYKTSWFTFQIGKRIATVHYMAMPNIMAGEAIFPEFIQDAATPENIANAAIDLLQDEPRRQAIRQRLATLSSTLGPPGAAKRAARAILSLLPS